MGSRFQWQRPADGHELIDYSSGYPMEINGRTNTISTNPNWTANDNKYINGGGSPNSWIELSINVQGPYTLWQNGLPNNPCPLGFYVPTRDEFRNLQIIVTGSSQWADFTSSFWNEKTLKLLSRDNVGTDYWLSDATSYPQGAQAWYFGFAQNYSSMGGVSYIAQGNYIRCIKQQ